MKKFFSIISITLLLCSQLAWGASIRGAVTDNAGGIAGVVVSDGYTVVATDKAGKYEMKRHPLAKFVFVSVPADCKIPHEGNIPRFYQPLDSLSTADTEANFALTKTAVRDTFTLIALADPQPKKSRDMQRFVNETIAELAGVEKEFPAGTTFLGMTAGDLCWNAPNLYPAYVKAFSKLAFPTYQVIGNHDHDENVHDDLGAAHYFEQYFGPTYYSFNFGKCHFVALDNIIHRSRSDYDEAVSKEQMEWLKKDLAFVNKDKLIIIGLHAPSIKYNGKGIKNYRELHQLLEGYEAFLFSGHTHRLGYVKVNDHLRDFNLAAVFGDSWAADIAPCGSPNGYGVFQLQGNRLANYYYKGTKQPKTYQLRLYPPGQSIDHEHSVVAYIWGWNEEWKMEVFEDGVSCGKMTNFKGTDPLAYKTFFGPEKPEAKPKLEPAPSQCLFYYNPKKAGCTVRVVVTDAFGNVYEEEVKVKSEEE
ncbi:MAG: calcineurin-like phosphoesterase family protein [Prevotellaceae bacterium]|jgi:hypothetical protein|nr:calcineurin-like phosphoesterase family protein [Prevotellaceae bacterium]